MSTTFDEFEPPPDEFDPGDEFDPPPPDSEYPTDGEGLGGPPPAEPAAGPLSANLEAMVEKAVLKRIQKEADAIAESQWHELLTPELFEQLQEAAARRLAAQIEAALAEPEPPPQPQAPPQLMFGSVEQFVRDKLAPTYRREVIEGSSRNWCPQWWKHTEAISRLEALWRAWEHLRLDPSTGMSVWWRDHADHHMAQLFDPEGTFKACSVRNGHATSEFEVVPLPTEPAPESMFPDMRTDDGSQPEK